MLRGHGRYLVQGNQVLSAPDRNLDPTYRINANMASQAGGAFQNANVGTAFGKNYTIGILEKLFGARESTDNLIRTICRDAYFYDSIMGGCADLMCDLPFGDFSLSGLPDKQHLDTYLGSLEKMRIKSLLPVIALDYLVDGAFLGLLSFDESSKVFTSILPQDLNNAELIFSPVFGHTPLVNMEVSPETRKFLQSPDKRAKDLIKEMPDWFVRLATSGNKIELNPDNIVYIPRRTLSSAFSGTSYFTRCLPIFLMEKALLHGTIEQAYRRQRAILHITAGDEDWEPNDEELENISNLFQRADMDPVGAIISTRQSINPVELLSGGQFWRYDESYDSFSQIKMRALGINESLLSGDSTWSTLDQSLSVFIQSLKAFRDIIVRRLFYEKIFPYIAHLNGYQKDQRNLETTGALERRDFVQEASGMWSAKVGSRSFSEMADFNPDDYIIPMVEWHNKLRPESDEAYMGILTQLAERGIPVPMRVFAAASGNNMDDLLGGLDQDVNDAQKIFEYKEKMKEFKGGEEEEGGFASVKPPKIGLGNREFPDEKRTLTVKGRKVSEEKIHKQAAEALAKAAVKENYRTKKQQEVSSQARKSQIYGSL